MKFKIFILFIVLSGVVQYSFAQRKMTVEIGKTDCEEKLDDALTLYNSGLYIESETLLKEINNSNCSLSKIRKQDAYELLIKNQLELDKVYQADTTAKSMLENYPHYELKEANNSEDYNRLIKKFDVYPLISIGARNDALTQSYKIKKTYSVLNNIDYNSSYKNNFKYVLMYYGYLEFGLNKNFSVNIEGIFNGFSYTREFTKDVDWKMTYSEAMRFMEMPIYLKAKTNLINFGSGKTNGMIFYGDIGIGYMRMLSAAASASLTYTQTDIYTSATTPIAEYANNINVLNMRNKNTLEALGEIGFGYRFRNFEVCLFVRDFRGLTSLTNSAHRFDNPLLIDYFYYIDDKVVLNKYELGATISFTLKNTVKKR